MSSLFVRTLREDPAGAEVASHKLLVRAGYIRRAAPGIYTWLPLGLKVLAKVEAIIREEMEAIGSQEVYFPGLLPKEPYEATGRWADYGPTLFKLRDRKEADYLLAPTHEEMFTLLVKDLYSSYKDLPLMLYQIQTKYRDEARPRAGLVRGRAFVMKDAYSFDVDDAGLDASYTSMRDAYERIFRRFDLPYVICSAMSGAMGGSRSEEFLFPCEAGEDSFVRSAGGYAANTEAFTTVRPPDEDFSDVGEAFTIRTPGANTIETLVRDVNAAVPRQDRPWQAADTLKNLVVVAIHPEGEREVVIIGMPGDRDADMKRVEAALAPAEVEIATAEDLEAFPELVPGYIGPMAIGPQARRRTERQGAVGRPEGAEGAAEGPATAADGPVPTEPARPVLRYLLDPHIARGSRWVTGANEADTHVVDLVYGRDFEADGWIEAAEVREGDEAPDGSGPVAIARGIEIGHIFQLGRKYAQSLGLTVLDHNGKSQVVTMGSYGIGVSRLVACLAEHNHDEAGLAWPSRVAPAQVHVLATGKDEAVFSTAAELAEGLEGAGVEVLYDDRRKVSAGVKFADYELLGMPFGLVVGRALADGNVEIRDRRSGQSRLVPVGDAVESLRQAVAESL
ncbi:MAG: proline--tRNA ligase [Actinomycetaceae bacterium]|nr:proline--tRNA ligase [Actinomycetaceae bacterium]